MITPKKKICLTCNTPQYIFSNKNCRDCWGRNKSKEPQLVFSTKNNVIKPSRKAPTHLEDKSLPELLKLTQIVVNKHVRERDSNDGYFTCISSGNVLPVSQMQAGHMFPVSTSSALRFDEDNINGQSISENCFNPDHQRKYRKNLIEKIGRFNVERLESLQHVEKKWSKEELIEIIKKYR